MMLDDCKLGASTNCYHAHDLDSALSGIQEGGFSYVELTSVPGWTEHVMPEEMSGADVRRLKEKLDERELKVIGISGHTDLTEKKGPNHLRECIDLADELDAEIVNTGISMKEDPDAELTDDELDRFYDNIHDLAGYAGDRNVNIGIETHDFLATAKQGIEILENIRSDRVGINYDTGNVVFYGGVRPEEDVKNLENGHLKNVHLKDKIGGKGEWNFPAVGKGEIGFEKIFDHLDSIGYERPISVEIEFDGSGEESCEEVDEAIRASYEFITRSIQ